MQIIDVSKDPYMRRYFAKVKRIDFEKLKRTKAFAIWKSAQYKLQKGRCAYCRVLFSKNNVVVHIDHVQPLYFEGANDLTNLVLACRKCNLHKWIDPKYVLPDWIKQQQRRQQLKELRAAQKKQMRQIIISELDEQCMLLMHEKGLL